MDDVYDMELELQHAPLLVGDLDATEFVDLRPGPIMRVSELPKVIYIGCNVNTHERVAGWISEDV